ncbi:MAG: dihydrofolate reductase [Porticoccaceae bacterium]|nr:dihydrofolate reductase [Porticoccaceae bacterium]
MKISLIVAVSRNGVIGIDNQLPWHLPEDLKYFKSVTMGKPIIMGRKTFDSIGRPLPGRTNIVITRDSSWQAEGVEVAQTLAQAMTLGGLACANAGVDEAMVIGGEQIYRMTLPAADRLYLTEVQAEVEGDAFFPEFDANQWQQVSEKIPELTDTHPYRFLVLERIKK